jgi:hypothetical protein
LYFYLALSNRVTGNDNGILKNLFSHPPMLTSTPTTDIERQKDFRSNYSFSLL